MHELDSCHNLLGAAEACKHTLLCLLQDHPQEPYHHQDYAKRPRTDDRQPSVASQAAHHRMQDMRHVRQEADRWAAERRLEELKSSRSRSPGSDKGKALPQMTASSIMQTPMHV